MSEPLFTTSIEVIKNAQDTNCKDIRITIMATHLEDAELLAFEAIAHAAQGELIKAGFQSLGQQDPTPAVV